MAKVQIGGLNLRGAAAADPAKKGENWTCACGCGAKVCQKGRFTRACAGRRRAGKDPKRPAALAVPTGIEVDPGQFGGVIPMITNRALSALSYAKSQSDAGHYDEAARVCREASAIFDAAAKLAKS